MSNKIVDNRKDKCVHTEHCCSIHGCKYADDDCPVFNMKKAQSYPCEECNEDNNEHAECNERIADLEHEIARLKAAHARYAGGDRKCSECGDDRKGLTLCCMNCLNNDGWSHSEHPAVGYAGGGEAVVTAAIVGFRAGWQYSGADGIMAATEFGNAYAAKFDRPAPAVPDVDLLAQFIRRIDGNNKMGAGALAEAIHEWITASQEGEHPALAVPESRNVMKIEREGDQSVKLTFASCRSCSAFISALIASKEGQ